MQQFLKAASGPTGTGVVSPELLQEFFVPMHHLAAALYASFGRETLAALTAALESWGGR
jgi:hypothetical protein